MPASRPIERPGASRGFTLLELLVAVGLMALLTAVFLPQLGGIFRFEIRGASRAMAADLEYASQRAIATGTLHHWVVDLDKQSFRIERLRDMPAPLPSETPTHAELLDLRAPIRAFELVPVENNAGEWRSIEQGGVWIDRVRVGDEEFRAGTVTIAFGPDGGADPAELVLADEGEHKLRIVIVAFTSEVRIEEVPEGV
jgi:prepilin-type N-terminal cleavage/methylation domain-containing protein